VTTGNLEIRSEQRAFHWVAWVSQPGETKPADSLLMVGRTQEEAEERVREWIKTGRRGY
jgi:hypothetical protein